MPAPEKPKAERLSETITILKKLQEVGIPTSDAGYQEIQAKMSAWVQTGAADSFTVIFARVARKAEVRLPRRADRAAEIVLKALT